MAESNIPKIPDSNISEILITDSAIKKEMNKLKKIFKNYYTEENEKGKIVTTDKGDLIERLISEAAFVRCVLLEAQRLIKLGGLETTTVNASQKFKKAVPAVGIYSDYLKVYTTVIDKLISYIPQKEERKTSRLEALFLSD